MICRGGTRVFGGSLGNKFRPYIECRQFDLMTDNTALSRLDNDKDKNSKLTRWTLKLRNSALHNNISPGRTDSSSRYSFTYSTVRSLCVRGQTYILLNTAGGLENRKINKNNSNNKSWKKCLAYYI